MKTSTVLGALVKPALLSLGFATASSASTTLYSNNFESTLAHPDWSTWGTTFTSVSGGSITSPGSYINPNFVGTRAWVVDGTPTAGAAAAGPWVISGSTPSLALAPNFSNSLGEITLSLQLTPNIYSAQATRVYLWDGVNFANRLESPLLFPGFRSDYSWSLATLTQVGTGLGGTSFSAVTLTVQLDGQTWAWGSADGYKALYIDNINLTTTAIPEPSSFAVIAALGSLGYVTCHRRRFRG